MKNMFYGAEPLWGSKVKWEIVNRDLDYLIHRHCDALKDAVMLARDLEVRLDSIFALLDDLCRVTCPWCPDPCCLTARVWIDFRDLLFLHLSGNPIPPEQLLSDFKESCRYWSYRGCMLPRISRPWVCTWHLCPTQKINFRRKTPSVQDKFRHVVQRIKACRKAVETEFVRIVS